MNTLQPCPSNNLDNSRYSVGAAVISREFQVTLAEIENLRMAGFGYAEITIAYILCRPEGLSVRAVLNRRATGEAWAEIISSAKTF
jgi:hypothetical protein